MPGPADQLQEMAARLKAFGVIMRLGHDIFNANDFQTAAVMAVNNARPVVGFRSSTLLRIQDRKADVIAQYAQPNVNAHSRQAVLQRNILEMTGPLDDITEISSAVANQYGDGSAVRELCPDDVTIVLVPLKPPPFLKKPAFQLIWLLEFDGKPPAYSMTSAKLLASSYSEALYCQRLGGSRVRNFGRRKLINFKRIFWILVLAATIYVMFHTRLEYGWKDLDMNESVLEKVTEGGVTNVINHGSNRILSESRWFLRPEYEYVSDEFDILADMNLEGCHSVSSQMYPYVYRESLVTWSLGAEAKFYLENIDWDFLDFYHFRGFELDAGLRYMDGAVRERRQIVSEDTGVQTEPYRLQEWYDRQMEYATAFSLSMKIGLRYNFWKGLYVSASGEWRCGMGLRHIPGHFRSTAVMSFGYDF